MEYAERRARAGYALRSPEGLILKEFIEGYVDRDLFNTDPLKMAYDVGQRDLARYLLNLAEIDNERN